MSRNGSGTYNLPAGNPVVTGTTISSTWANNTLTDMATAITGSIAADGQTPITGALDFNTQDIDGTPTFTGNVTFASTGFIKIPAGTIAERPASPVEGEIRFNIDYGQFEGYYGTGWSQIGGGATGGGGDAVFVENSRIVTTSYALPADKSAESVGPITINSGATVTIPSDQRWVIL
jgi:hypothetical protein